VLVNVLISSAAVLLTGGVIESVTRAFDLWPRADYSSLTWYRPSDIPGVPYQLKPDLDRFWGAGRVITNGEGLRDRRSFGSQPDGALRILALGDSVTFGFGVDQDDTFPRELERLLNDVEPQGKAVEVINAGVNGFNLSDEVHYLRRLLERYHPGLVVWTLVANDYDDSFGIDENGLVSWLVRDYSASVESLKLGLGLDPSKPVDTHDFCRSMRRSFAAWAEGRPIAPNVVELWLRSHVRSYAWAESVITGAFERYRPVTGLEGPAEFRVTHTWSGSDGKRRVIEYSPLFSVRSRVRAYTQLMIEARGILEAQGLPVLVVNTGLPSEPEVTKESALFRYVDADTILREPFRDFIQRHNLGWDGHFNAKGNRLFARAVLLGLTCKEFVRGQDGDCPRVASSQLAMNDYWRAFNAWRERTEARFLPFIDFERCSGLHQIAGGVLPPRDFPAAPRHRAVMLLARPRGPDLSLKLKDVPVSGLKVKMRVRAGTSVTEEEQVLTPASSEVHVSIANLLQAAPTARVFEVEVLPMSDGASARLVYLGSR